MNVLGKVHNAKKVTLDGRDAFIASIQDLENKLLGRGTPEVYNNVSEHTTAIEAVQWLREQARTRGLEMRLFIVEEENRHVEVH